MSSSMTRQCPLLFRRFKPQPPKDDSSKRMDKCASPPKTAFPSISHSGEAENPCNWNGTKRPKNTFTEVAMQLTPHPGYRMLQVSFISQLRGFDELGVTLLTIVFWVGLRDFGEKLLLLFYYLLRSRFLSPSCLLTVWTFPASIGHPSSSVFVRCY